MFNRFYFLFFYLFFSIHQIIYADQETVIGRDYPIENTVEFNSSGGSILNQSFVDSYSASTHFSYFFTRSFGLAIDGVFLFNFDKAERECLETFINDPEGKLAASCVGKNNPQNIFWDAAGKPISGVNYGPAYVAIRELQHLISLELVWTPFYGKQLALLSLLSHFDQFFTIGGGYAQSLYYPQSLFLRNGILARGKFPNELPDGFIEQPGVSPENTEVNNLVGPGGRPDPIKRQSPIVSFGFGQKFHFLKIAHLIFEFKTYILIDNEIPGTYDKKIEPFFLVKSGLGIRL